MFVGRSLRISLTAVLAACGCMAGPVLAGGIAVPEDLRPGVVRYALATGDAPDAVRMIGAMNGEEAPLLRARAWLDSGHRQQGLEELRRISDSDTYRAKSSMLLGRAALEQADSQQAARWFGLAARYGFGEDKQEALYHLADFQRQAGAPEKAGKILSGMEAGYWAAVGYGNLASDYAQQDTNPARALVALRVALAMTEADQESDRQEDLRNRLLARAGYLAYQNGEYDKAIGFLEKVALDSPVTPLALYFHGLALAERGNHRAAMQSWHRAKKFPLAYAGVADAWIGMGRGYDLAGYLGQAGEAYLAANAAYESERVTLRKLKQQIREKGAYGALVKGAQTSDLEWFLADSRTMQQPRQAYLMDFLDTPSAQIAVARVARLERLDHRLSQEQSNLDVLLSELDHREKGGSADQGELRQLRAEGNALGDQVERLLEKATGAEQKRRLAEIDRILGDADSALTAVSHAGSTSGGVGARLKALLSEIAGYRERVSALRATAESRLNELALAYVDDQDQRMVYAYDKTEQQIAHLYEYLALENLQETSQ